MVFRPGSAQERKQQQRPPAGSALKSQSSFVDKKRSTISTGGAGGMQQQRRSDSPPPASPSLMYRRPSSAMTSLRRETPAIVKGGQQQSPPARGAGAGESPLDDTVSNQMSVQSPALSSLYPPSPTGHQKKRTLSRLSIDSGGGGAGSGGMLLNNMSFRTVFGESIRAEMEGGMGRRKRSVLTGNNGNSQKKRVVQLVGTGQKEEGQAGEESQGHGLQPSTTTFKAKKKVAGVVMQQALRRDTLLEDMGGTESFATVSPQQQQQSSKLAGFRRVGTDSTGKVVRQDLTTNLFWRECLNDAAVHRELVLYNYLMSHSVHRATTVPQQQSGSGLATSISHGHCASGHSPPAGGFGASGWGGFNTAAATQQVDVDTTVQVGGRLVQKAPDWSQVPIRKPAIPVDFVLTLEGNDQRYVSVGATVSASEATANARSLLLSMSGGGSTHNTSFGKLNSSSSSGTTPHITAGLGGSHHSSTAFSTTTSTSGSFGGEQPQGEGGQQEKAMYRVVPFLLTEPYEMTLDEACKTPGTSVQASILVGWLRDVVGQLACLHQVGVLHNVTTADTVVLCAKPTVDQGGSNGGGPAAGKGGRKTSSLPSGGKGPDHNQSRSSTATSGGPSTPMVAKLSNMSCATVYDEKRLMDLSPFTMRQQRAAGTSSPYHSLPLSHLPARMHHLPPEWTAAPVVPTPIDQGGRKSGKRVTLGSDLLSDDSTNVGGEGGDGSGRKTGGNSSEKQKGGGGGGDPAQGGSGGVTRTRRGSVLLGKLATFNLESIAVMDDGGGEGATPGKGKSGSAATHKLPLALSNPFTNWAKKETRLSPLESFVQSGRRVIPSRASDSFCFGKLLSYVFFANAQGGAQPNSSGGAGGGVAGGAGGGGVRFLSPQPSEDPESPVNADRFASNTAKNKKVTAAAGHQQAIGMRGRGKRDLDPLAAAARAQQQLIARIRVQFPLNPNMVGTDQLGLVELKHLVECLVRKQSTSRWLLEHAADHPFFWSPPVIRAFLGLILRYVGSTEGAGGSGGGVASGAEGAGAQRRPSATSSKSATTLGGNNKKNPPRKREYPMSHDLTVWVTSPVLWLPAVQDWYDAICRENQQGIRYDYENSVEDQLQFFVNVYEHLVKYQTKTICNGDAAQFTRLFVHSRFPGLLHTLAVRVLADHEDEEQLCRLMDRQFEATTFSDLRGTGIGGGAVGGTFTGGTLTEFTGSMLPPPALAAAAAAAANTSKNFDFAGPVVGSEDGDETASPGLDPLGRVTSADPEVTSDATTSTIDCYVRRLALDLRDHQLVN